LAQRWIDFLPAAAHGLEALCACVGARRTHYDWRLCVFCTTVAEITHGLKAVLACDPVGPVASGSVRDSSARLAFVFSGQGQQWIGMGRDLLESEPAFQAALRDIDQRFLAMSGWSIIEELDAPEAQARLDETEVAQPVI